MALFGSKKNTAPAPVPIKESKIPVVKESKMKRQTVSMQPVKVGPSKHQPRDLSGIIRRPHITEKASFSAERGVYIFNVAPTSTKHTVAAAIIELYKVTPVKVTMAAITTKRKLSRSGWGTKGGDKKAHVFLKKGDVIEFV